MAYNAGAPTGNLVLLSKQTASASASLTFTTGITGYDYYILEFYNATVSNNSASILLTMSTNGGGSYLATGYYEAGYFSNAGALNVWNQPNINFHYLIYALDNASTSSANGSTNLYNLASSALWKIVIHEGSGITAGVPLNLKYSGFLNTTSPVNALKVATDVGTFSGTFKLYGVQN